MPSNHEVLPVDLGIYIHQHPEGVDQVYLRLDGFGTSDVVGLDWQHRLANVPLGTTLTVTVVRKTRKTEERL